MNRTAVVKLKQSIYDIAVQYCGGVDAVNDIAVLNDISTDDDLQAGTVLLLPAIVDNSVVNNLSINKIEPASGDISELKEEGIDFWAIDIDFVVQ